MSLYLYFFQGSESTYDVYMPSTSWTPMPGGRLYSHVELRINNNIVITRDGIDTTYVADWEDVPKDVKVTRIKLPHTPKQIERLLDRRSKLRLDGHPYRYRDFRHAANNAICPKSYFKKGFTCATMVAYLLEFEHYYAMCPDDIWVALLTGKQTINYNNR